MFFSQCFLCWPVVGWHGFSLSGLFCPVRFSGWGRGCSLVVLVGPGSSWVWSGGFYGEFDPGSGRTLAACLTHASRTVKGPAFVGPG